MTATPDSAQKSSLTAEEQPLPPHTLRPFFRPDSIAVVGASQHPRHIGARILHALIQGGYHGPIYPVNPCATQLAGLTAYPNVRAIPGVVDLAIVATPRDAVLGVVDDCAAKGVRGLLVITAGFAEAGPEGAALQQTLLQKVRAAGMRLIGPNCLGLINTDPAISLNATFVPIALGTTRRTAVPHGRIAMSSESGALGMALLSAATDLGLGVSSCVSVGNRADVTGNDLLEYWADDPDTGIIVLYLESFGDPRRFARVAQRVSRSKPIVAMKAGRTGTGRRAADSHTGALAATDIAVDALFRQTGILRVDTVEEMLDLTAALSMQPLPGGRRVGIISNAGGPAILCADACDAARLVVPVLREATQHQLRSFLPAEAGVANPVDMIASAGPEQYRRAITTLVNSGEIDALIILYIGADTINPPAVKAAIEASLSSMEQGRRLPVLACLMADPAATGWLGSGIERIPCYRFPEEPARALGRMADYADWCRQDPGRVPAFADVNLASARTICRRATEKGGGWLSTEDTGEILRAAGLNLVPGGVAHDADQTVELARRVGFPVVVKLSSRHILHKTERGAVRLNLRTEDEVRQAYEAIRASLASENALGDMEGVLVQPMIQGATEVLVGVTHDPLFGPLVAFGLGGVHVEILGDVCFRVTPLTDRDAAGMVRSIRGYRLLQGYRGHPPADIQALEEVLLRVSHLVEMIPEVVELDLNPVFAMPPSSAASPARPGQNCLVADARLRLAGPGRDGATEKTGC